MCFSHFQLDIDLSVKTEASRDVAMCHKIGSDENERNASEPTQQGDGH